MAMFITYVRFWEIERITHFRPPSSLILSYINIFNTNRKLLAQAFTLTNAKESFKYFATLLSADFREVYIFSFVSNMF